MIPKKFLYPSSPQVRVKLLKMSLRENQCCSEAWSHVSSYEVTFLYALTLREAPTPLRIELQSEVRRTNLCYQNVTSLRTGAMLRNLSRLGMHMEGKS